MYRAKISPNLKKIFEKGERGEVLTLLLADGDLRCSHMPINQIQMIRMLWLPE